MCRIPTVRSPGFVELTAKASCSARDYKALWELPCSFGGHNRSNLLV